jgi:antitoxin component of MazEF toxin-antitoxin module
MSKPQIRGEKQLNRKPLVMPANLEHLLARVTKENLHREFETGPAVGKEII